MNTEDTIQEIELSIQQAKQIVAFGDALERLLRNADFQLVIDKGYMTDESRRLTLLLGDPNVDEKTRTNITLSLRSIGELHQFFQVRRAFAEEMKTHIVRAEEELDDIQNGTGDDA